MTAVDRHPRDQPGKNARRQKMNSSTKAHRSNSVTNFDPPERSTPYRAPPDASAVGGEVASTGGKGKEPCRRLEGRGYGEERSGMRQHERFRGNGYPLPCQAGSRAYGRHDGFGARAPPTEKETLDELCRILEAVHGARGGYMADCFKRAGLPPPITKQSLSELDMGAIINNPKLRHDVNFDRELHFRPNFDGARGRAKMKAQEEYWSALTAELKLYAALFHGAAPPWRARFCRSQIARVAKRRIPLMFETIRDILKHLVPERDQVRVDERLDVEMLMQQIEKGVCDLVNLAEWLGRLLKEHCAPMRDEWVDAMVEQTRVGVQMSCASSIVDGLRKLLGILEAMKLDVANHQIRHLRAVLVEDTIPFERKYHLYRIGRRRINVEQSQEWYKTESLLPRDPPPPFSAKDEGRIQLEVFVRGLVRILLAPDDGEPFPETFYLDAERLRALRVELRDLIYFEICCDVFSELCKHVGCPSSLSPDFRQSLRDLIAAIVGDTSGSDNGRCWKLNVEYVAAELVRKALLRCGRPCEFDSALVSETEKGLRERICWPHAAALRTHAARLEAMILPRVIDLVAAHMTSSPMDIFSALMAPPSSSPHPPAPPPPPPLPPSPLAMPTPLLQKPTVAELAQSPPPRVDAVSDIIRRTAHIAVLHWRIWAPIVYLRESSLPAPVEQPEQTFLQTATSSASQAQQPESPEAQLHPDGTAPRPSWSNSGAGGGTPAGPNREQTTTPSHAPAQASAQQGDQSQQGLQGASGSAEAQGQGQASGLVCQHPPR